MNPSNRQTRNDQWEQIVKIEDEWWENQSKNSEVQADGAKTENELISKSTDHPHVYKWQDLKRRHQKAHGTFFFGPDSRQITIPEEAKYEPQL